MQGLNFEQCVTTLNVNAKFSRLNSKAWCHITNSHHFYCLRHVLHLHTFAGESDQAQCSTSFTTYRSASLAEFELLV